MEQKQKNIVLGSVAGVCLLVGGFLIYRTFSPPAPPPIKADAPSSKLTEQLKQKEQAAAKKRPPPPPEEVNAEPGSGRRAVIPK